ncbi:MAG: hypothetical protein H6R26_772, partial [Proteobacteria bacterium]|nr:hypothetical protein [Pseudomonadota bacterium]
MFSVDITPKDEQRRGQAAGIAKTRHWAEIPRRTSRHDQSTNACKRDALHEAAGNSTLTLRWRHY